MFSLGMVAPRFNIESIVDPLGERLLENLAPHDRAQSLVTR
ncbi:uncharacterized protein METZ01_LOCUS162446 [marine metagenome]|uniref:Uncharacterized protein n=1 Tax=marine metagenome TaxID=408172 RepID=A0A382B8I0_9ZZZZ